MRNNLKETINEIIADILELEGSDESLFSRESNTTWDSIKHLEIIMAVEEEFDIRFSTTEVTDVKNASDIFVLVNEKLS